ncbi:MAG TPA: hypothetical protein VNU46_02500 [Gemmatimonadaceae bacterium]|jgi:hypothetical protein|nr:hypothetical protein [Gemmatimonadaceae bacterium]
MHLPDPSHDPLDDEIDESIWRDENALIDGVPVRDWSAVMDYVTGNDTPEAHSNTESRLNTDPAFAEFARPIIAMWRLPLPQTHTRDLDAGWASIQRKTAALKAVRSKVD